MYVDCVLCSEIEKSPSQHISTLLKEIIFVVI